MSQAPQQPATPDHAPAPSPETLRQAVQRQPTIGQGIIALLRGIAYSSQHGGGDALAKAIDADPKAWSDAVLANTPEAVETATTLAPVPSDVAAAVAPPQHAATAGAAHR
jgi:hypothetical protein